ncbi:MAG TPA: 5-bromo-4-chloroindolyl phosphate hydrolysis family protein [Candidatus Merdisoma merdipullorum]|nr:5-bromo-4-chloroindolyl phosphate hydrolysis family protein [Candidatus Merdisoma merdipullorum]
MKETITIWIATLISCGVFLVFFLKLGWGIFPSALLCVGLYVGLSFVLKPQKKLGGINIERLQGGEELRKLLDEAQEDLRRIGKAAKEISNIQAKRDAEALEDGGLRILEYLEENPEKINMARRFFTYYLDTAAGLLERYVQLQETGLRTPEVTEAIKRTAGALPTLNTVFEKQFTRLMEGELLDVEAEINLLENTLKMEGGK